MFEFSWNLTKKSYMSNWAKFLQKRRVPQGKSLLAALGRNWYKKALTLSEKDLEAVVHGSVVETEELGLNTVKLCNWIKPVLINSKDTAI